jgi:hypothetical protein
VLNKEFDRFWMNVAGPFRFDLVQCLTGIAALIVHATFRRTINDGSEEQDFYRSDRWERLSKSSQLIGHLEAFEVVDRLDLHQAAQRLGSIVSAILTRVETGCARTRRSAPSW